MRSPTVLLRVLLFALLATTFTFIGAAKAQSMFELPHGRFMLTAGSPEMCMEVLPNHRMHLTFQGTDDRHPVVLDGEYAVSATKMGDFHFKFTVESIHTKTLSKCRKYWIDEALTSTTRLDTVMRPGSVLRFTAKFSCVKDQNTAQLCLHDGGADGKQVICRNLVNHQASCKEEKDGPAINGALINAPARPVPKPVPPPSNPPPNSPKPSPPINDDAVLNKTK